MFTIDEIKAAHAKVKSGADFPAYIQALKQLGVKHYVTYVADGDTDYTGYSGHTVSTDAKYPTKQIASNANNEKFVVDLRTHQSGGTDYPTFCSDCAQNGVHNWVVDLDKMTCTYYDSKEGEMLVEQIPQ